MSFDLTIKNNWGKLGAALVERAEKVVDRTATEAFDLSQTLVPVDTGELKDSGRVEPGENRTTRYIVYGTDHAWYPEFGTRNMAAEPYLIPAMVNANSRLLEYMKDILKADAL